MVAVVPIQVHLGTAWDEFDPWVDPSALTGLTDDTTVDLAGVARATTEILFRLSGKMMGQRDVTVRPHPLVKGCGCSLAGWSAYVLNPYGMGAAYLYDQVDPASIKLHGPVVAINTVKIDGVALPTTAYHLYGSRRLVRGADAAGNSQWWPRCQRMDLADTEAGTWSIDYTWGTPVSQGAQLSARELAVEVVKLLAGDQCKLAGAVTSMTRQGVQIKFDPAAFLDKGKTGLPFTDLWLESVNPGGKRRNRAVIASPESIRQARVNP